MKDLTYKLPGSLGIVIFSEAALRTISTYRQCGFFSKEAGGQLFAEIENGVMRIVDATEPRKKDRRGKFSFWPHRPTEQTEIKERFKKKGLHFVGDWHTHPESTPSPSGSDARSIAETMRQSRHTLPGILLVIIGTLELPDGLYVGFQTKTMLYKLDVLTTGEKVV
ncbi:MAG TPA: Mov34/MPN/PAD-1 family protein [Candidatus Paceibacterota bacterium]|nr:Mov34/MPN/PAD-1 family protein [Candidatus Paceibacterota bacterium]